MKRSQIILAFSAVISAALFFVAGCTNVPVDPATPIVPVGGKKDSTTTSTKNGITIKVEATPSAATLILGEQLQLSARVTALKDTTATDSLTKNYVLTDSSVTWSIMSGDGSITAKGLYTAPASIPGVTHTVMVKARSNADVKAYAVVTISVRKPNLMPMSIGSYWVYENYPLDTLTNQRIISRKSLDSTLVMGQVLQGGRLSSMVLTYRNAIPHDTVYYYNDNGIIWAYTRLNDNLSTSPLQRQWIKVLDPNATQWVAYDSTLMNVPVTVNNQPALLSGRLTLVCNRGKVDSVTAPAGTFAAQDYTITFTVNMILRVNGIDIPIQYSVPAHQWYSDNVGLVRSMTELFQVVNPFGGALRRSSEESVLSSYSLKNP